jgi:cytidylate kinase
MGEPLVVAIDGPAGSGKSTIARRLAARLGLSYLDTGAMYRAVAYAALRARVDPSDAVAVGRLAEEMHLEVDDRVTVDGVDATEAIRGPEVSAVVSIVAAHPSVRSELRDRQRAWVARHGGGVVEGRDIGSVVFPEAAAKVYLDARPEVRAARRAAEHGAATPDQVAEWAANLADRDRRDSNREDSPLVEADGAVVIDTSDLDIEEVVDAIVELLR